VICTRVVTRNDPVMRPCPECGHLLALHIGCEQCPVCMLLAHPVLHTDAVELAIREGLYMAHEGDVLVVLVPPYVDQDAVDRYQKHVSSLTADVPVKGLILAGDHLAVVKADATWADHPSLEELLRPGPVDADVIEGS